MNWKIYPDEMPDCETGTPFVIIEGSLSCRTAYWNNDKRQFFYNTYHGGSVPFSFAFSEIVANETILNEIAKRKSERFAKVA